MVGFNPLKEKIHSFEEATKILRWDSDSLLRKANEGHITPLVYLEWEGNTSISPDPILTPEGESEWRRLSEAGLNIRGVSSFFPEALKLNKRHDWLTIANIYYRNLLIPLPIVSVFSATIFSHTSFPAPPKGHRWIISFANNFLPEITVENLYIREFDLKRIDSQFENNKEGKEKRIWKIQLNKELSDLKNLFEKFEYLELFESESLERLYQHFNSFSLRDPVPDHATPLQWLGTWNSLVYVLRKLKGTEWIEATDKSLEQNHFITKEGKPFKIGKGSVDENTSDVKDVKEILKIYL